MQYVDSLLDLIGHTPLLRLSRTLDAPLGQGEEGPMVLAKVEYLNPGGSVKDRIATRMIEAAEASGELQPGGIIVEPTSGNTGVGLALVAQQAALHRGRIELSDGPLGGLRATFTITISPELQEVSEL